MNIYHEPSCPIYMPINISPNEISIFVELSPTPIWVVAKITPNYFKRIPDAPNPGLFVDLISYWIWQFGKELSISLADVDNNTPLELEVKINESAQWSKGLIPDKKYKTPLSIEIISESKILITFNPSVVILLNTSDNSGEIKVIEFIIDGLTKLLILYGWTKPSRTLRDLKL